MARIGILGGTFDPPHIAHVTMALASIETLGLAKVFFTPAYLPPHKGAGSISPYEHRVEMALLAAAGYKGIEVSRIEERRGGVSFTVDLLRDFQASYNGDLYFILGADSLQDFPSWKDPREILRLATIVVFPRGKTPPFLDVEGDASLVVFEEPLIDVSSNDLRRRYRDGEPIGSLVPEPVDKYIRDNYLFRG